MPDDDKGTEPASSISDLSAEAIEKASKAAKTPVALDDLLLSDDFVDSIREKSQQLLLSLRAIQGLQENAPASELSVERLAKRISSYTADNESVSHAIFLMCALEASLCRFDSIFAEHQAFYKNQSSRTSEQHLQLVNKLFSEQLTQTTDMLNQWTEKLVAGVISCQTSLDQTFAELPKATEKMLSARSNAILTDTAKALKTAETVSNNLLSELTQIREEIQKTNKTLPFRVLFFSLLTVPAIMALVFWLVKF